MTEAKTTEGHIMLAYHNDNALKNSVVAEMRGHREAERLVKGKYWDGKKGCAVGCLIKSGNHAEYETRFGIPRVLARLEDGIFEGLAMEDAKAWPERFLGAITPGQDLSIVSSRFLHWILTDAEGIRKYAKPEELSAIEKVSALYERRLKGQEPSRDEWIEAYELAVEARRAAYAAAAAAYAAYAAAYAAYAAAAAAADAAAAAWRTTRGKYYSRMADKLIELIRSASVI